MSEISYLDGKFLKPFFKLMRKSGLGLPITYTALKGVEYFGNGAALKGRYGIKRIKWGSFNKLILVGQSHLDAAWRWKTKQGILKARATLSKAIEHINDPSLPYFTFSQPSPCYYQWMKDYFPDLYKQIKQQVKNGRIIPIGGMWVESDTNIPNGESLVRQRLYGQRFYLKEFGFISDVEFLQDCFGFNRNLPQIFKKSGARIFGTGKLFWNKGEKIPIGMCKWKSPDGTELPMIHINFGYFIPITYGKEYPLIYLLGKKGKKLVANYRTKPEEFQRWRSKEYMLNTIFGYGLGDGGHGPIELEIMIVEFMRKIYPKKIKHHQRGDFYNLFKKFFDRWAVWDDEWYLALHRGTYTSVSLVKRGNRDSENILEHGEKLLCSIAPFIEDFSGAIPPIMKNKLQTYKKYPDNIHDMRSYYEYSWKTVLYNQFHDILPGSSIPEVYMEYLEDLKGIKNSNAEIYKRLQKVIFKQFEKQVLALINQKGLDVKNCGFACVFNSLSWKRNDLIEIEVESAVENEVETPVTNEVENAVMNEVERDGKSGIDAKSNPKVQLKEISRIMDLSGKVLPFQIQSTEKQERKNSQMDSEINTYKGSNALILIQDLPGYSFTPLIIEYKNQNTGNIIEGTSKALNSAENSDVVTIKETTDDFVLNNHFLEVTINKRSGLVTRIKDTKLCENILSEPSFNFRIYEERKGSDAWNIDPNYEKQEISYPLESAEVQIIKGVKTDEILKKTVQVKRNIGKSEFIQRFSLSANYPELITTMDINLKDINWLVKLEISLNIDSDTITSEIPYSFIDRTIEPVTKLDAARWEHACQKFVSIHDKKSDIGITLSNNGKYAYSIKKIKTTSADREVSSLKLRPTLVRSPNYTGYYKETLFVNRAPDGGIDPELPRYIDIELHKDIKFGMQIHKGDWRNAHSWQGAYNLNFPLRTKSFPIDFLKQTMLSELKSVDASEPEKNIKILTNSADNVRIGTFKIAEDDQNPNLPKKFILRCVEMEGKLTDFHIEFHQTAGINAAKMVDLLEFDVEDQKDASKIGISGNKINLQIEPYEILTVYIEFLE